MLQFNQAAGNHSMQEVNLKQTDFRATETEQEDGRKDTPTLIFLFKFKYCIQTSRP